MNCSECGNELNEGAKFCTKCGNKVRLNRLFIPSFILILIWIIGVIAAFLGVLNPILVGYMELSGSTGITLALFSLYKNKYKMNMIVGILPCTLNLLINLLNLRWNRVESTLNIILSGAIILAFILLYKKRHKIILIAGIAVIALSLVLSLRQVLHSGW